MNKIYSIIPAIAFFFTVFTANANINVDDTTKYVFPSVNILGNKSTAIDHTPGTVNIISKSMIEFTRGVNGSQVFETIPGLNVFDEEGVGLRLNLSIRGLDPDRSRSILILEDGMPIALAPYGEPESYYTPLMDRMSGVEIVKGSGSIVYGPQTIGGVINFLTNEPRDIDGLGIRLNGGNGGYLNSKIAYGSSTSNMGFLVEYNRKEASKLGITRFNVNDIMMKFNISLNSRSSLRFKLGFYDEESNSTYVGITQSMYDKGDYFTHIAPDDHLDIRRYSGQLTHQYIFSKNAYIVTNLYGYTTTRNWKRQDFAYTKPSNWTGIVHGDTTIPGGAIYMRNQTGNRDRQFEVAGLQPQLFYNYSIGDIANELTTGIRFHFERAFEQRINGSVASALKGALVSDEVRTGTAASVFVQNRLFPTQNLIITPGVRFEHFNYERQINRTSSRDTLLIGSSNVAGLIPGLGINYNISQGFGIFAGIHKGFAPPRTKDAISNNGTAIELDAELSWNSEVGIRLSHKRLMNFELTAYHLDFSNQIIPISESSGGLGTDAGYINGGATLHYGIESSIGLNLSELLNTDYGISLTTSFNFGSSTYNSDRFIQINTEEKRNVNGNKLPYAPELSFSASLLVAAPFGTTIYLTGKYFDKHFTDELNTITPSTNGQIGLIKSRFIINATLEHKINNPDVTLFVSIKNLLDERYISSRRPQGIKVGLPQLFVAGIDFRL